jgi:hypothetical protein
VIVRDQDADGCCRLLAQARPIPGNASPLLLPLPIWGRDGLL